MGKASHCHSQCQKQLPANFITCHSFLGTAAGLVKYSMHMCTTYICMCLNCLFVRHLPDGASPWKLLVLHVEQCISCCIFPFPCRQPNYTLLRATLIQLFLLLYASVPPLTSTLSLSLSLSLSRLPNAFFSPQYTSFSIFFVPPPPSGCPLPSHHWVFVSTFLRPRHPLPKAVCCPR